MASMLACGICPRVSSSVPSTSMAINLIMRVRQYCACDRWGTISSRRVRMRLDEFSGVNAGYVLELFERYRQDPQSVDPQTRKIFESWTPVADEAFGNAAARTSVLGVHKIVGAATRADCIRRYGHLAARLDPLGSEPVGDPSLSPAAHGITDADLETLPASLVGGPAAQLSRTPHR